MRGREVVLARGFEVELARLLSRRLGGRVERFVDVRPAGRLLASGAPGWHLALASIEPTGVRRAGVVPERAVPHDGHGGRPPPRPRPAPAPGGPAPPPRLRAARVGRASGRRSNDPARPRTARRARPRAPPLPPADGGMRRRGSPGGRRRPPARARAGPDRPGRRSHPARQGPRDRGRAAARGSSARSSIASWRGCAPTAPSAASRAPGSGSTRLRSRACARAAAARRRRGAPDRARGSRPAPRREARPRRRSSRPARRRVSATISSGTPMSRPIAAARAVTKLTRSRIRPAGQAAAAARTSSVSAAVLRHESPRDER